MPNAAAPIRTPSGQLTYTSYEQFKNASAPIISSEAGMAISLRYAQPVNAASPISLSAQPSSNTMSVRFGAVSAPLALNSSAGMRYTPLPTYSVSPPLSRPAFLNISRDWQSSADFAS